MVKTSATSSSSTTNNAVEPNELKYKGVRKRKWGKYVSEIRLPNSRERIWLGSYDTAEKAARAFDAALFCLRGHNAKFNFPDDPPHIAGGRALTPVQIPADAQDHSNIDMQVVEMENIISPSGGVEEYIDWSFLDTLDSNSTSAGNISDFGIFPEPGDHMYMPPHFTGSDDDNDYDNDNNHNNNNNNNNSDHGSGGNVTYFLWNF
ncbi:hypothetical protein ACJIZ3_001492 [Penstemon smallii]|uniref:AP2/ERF domain-containing protein n=1 Tax=Penstemon smallii TaxID=265156 RepID=A0ABD3U3Q7_9LAMI